MRTNLYANNVCVLFKLEIICDYVCVKYYAFIALYLFCRVRIPERKPIYIGTSLAAAVLAKSKDDAYEEEIILCVKKAKLAEMKGEFDDADKMYHKALGVLTDYEEKKLWEEDQLLQSRVYIYDNMANLALSQGRFDDAESLYQDTLKGLLQQGFSEEHNAVLEVSLKCAMIFAMRGEFEKAELGYKHIIDRQRRKVESDNYSDTNSVSLLGMFANSYARFLLFRKRFEEAEVQMEAALDAAKKSLGEDHLQIPVLYSDIGNIASMQNHLDKALQNMKTAIDIAQRIKSPDLPVYLCNMGELYLKRGDIKQAKKHCGESLKLAEKSGDKESVKMAKICLENAKDK